MFAAWMIKQDQKKLAKAMEPPAPSKSEEAEKEEVKALWARFDTDQSAVLGVCSANRAAAAAAESCCRCRCCTPAPG